MDNDDILDIIENGLILFLADRGAVSVDLGKELIPEFVDTIRQSYGGIPAMIKHGPRKCTERQVNIIRREFNGRNRRELQEKYGISRATLYRYLSN